MITLAIPSPIAVITLPIAPRTSAIKLPKAVIISDTAVPIAETILPIAPRTSTAKSPMETIILPKLVPRDEIIVLEALPIEEVT